MTDTSWYPGNYRPDPAYPPHYRTMPDYIRIADIAALTLTGKRLEFWERCRDSALGEWAPTGIRLRLRGAGKPYGANRVTFALADPQNDKPAGHCFEVCPPIVPGTPGAGWLHVDPETFEGAFLGRNSGWLRYLIAHEFGHALGFGHGGDGIMDETPSHAVVNAEELAVAKAYWLGGTQ